MNNIEERIKKAETMLAEKMADISGEVGEICGEGETAMALLTVGMTTFAAGAEALFAANRSLAEKDPVRAAVVQDFLDQDTAELLDKARVLLDGFREGKTPMVMLPQAKE